MENPVSFAFEDHLVRVVMRADDPWFVARDVCGVLGLSNSRKALDRLDDDEKGVHNVHTPGGAQDMAIVSEPGLYALTFTSRKPEARRFSKWVRSEVLPEIRRTGEFRPNQPKGVTSSDTLPPEITVRPADLLSSDLNSRVKAVSVALRLFGLNAARRAWLDAGLPNYIADRDQDSPIVTRAFEALERILRAPLGERLLLDVLRDAIAGNRLARDTLLPLGIRVLERDDAIAFASSTAFMRRLFPDPGQPVRDLSDMSGARRGKLYFETMQSRCVLLPLGDVEDAVNAYRQDLDPDN